jgi:hypothetical protein
MMTQNDDDKQRGMFISTPISVFSESELSRFRWFCSKLYTKLIESDSESSFYCANVAIEGSHLFDSPHDSAHRDFEELRRLDSFVLLYPTPVPSSSLIELGYALALRKRILIVAPRLEDLPFLARGLTMASHNTEVLLADPICEQSFERILEFSSFHARFNEQ